MRKRGSKHPKSKLIEKDINRIRSMWFKDRIMQKAIARIFNVSTGSIQAILYGKTWRHVKWQI